MKSVAFALIVSAVAPLASCRRPLRSHRRPSACTGIAGGSAADDAGDAARNDANDAANAQRCNVSHGPNGWTIRHDARGHSQQLGRHIAFLKAELKITEPQQKAWDEFADALRTNAKSLGAAPNPMMGTQPW
jgi:hypothetical protein